jgi:mono/diheme cytochrome c family protein
MKLALAVASAVILIIHGIVFYDQFFHLWERHQTAYFDQAKTQARNDAERKELSERSPKIEQIIVTQFGEDRVDRCESCHLAIDDPRFKDHFQPLKTHPYTAALGDTMRNGRWERRHKFTDFGCTVCHDGQGRGLEVGYAHGEDEHWNDPLTGYVTQAAWRKEFVQHLKGKEYMEANCAQCHTEDNFAGTPHVNRGRQLFFETNCYGCHKIEGMSEGTLAPELTEAGHKFKIDYLWESIVDPRANLATSFMPKFNLSDDDVKCLVIFLKSRRGVNFSETSLARYRARLTPARAEITPEAMLNKPLVKAADLITQGKQLFDDRACTACHRMGDKDGGIAPDLSFEGRLKDEDWLREHFRAPRSRIPDSIMPAFRFSDADFTALSAYLASRQDVPKLGSDGAEMFKTLCSRCHGEKGDGLGKTAWYLDPTPRDLTKASFMNSKPEERFLNSIKNGVAGTSMPAWGKTLSDDQIHTVFGYVRTAFVKEPPRPLKEHSNIPESNPTAATADSLARGEATYLKRCTGCHGLKADGKGPNSLDIVPRPRNLRNRWFVTTLKDHRALSSILYGVQGTAMPSWIDYGLTMKDASDLLNYIRSLNPPPAAAAPKPAERTIALLKSGAH